MKFKPNQLTRVALMAAVLCVTSQWSIPIGPVPITLATFFITMCGALLGPLYGGLSVIVYLLLGALGLPVFSGFRGGIGVFAGATGGFLWGYLALVVLTGLGGSRDYWQQAALGLAGLIILYAAGTTQLMFVANLTLAGALSAAVLPFIVKDVLSVGLAILLGRLIKRRL